MTERAGLDSTWGHSIKASGVSANTKSSGINKTGGGGGGVLEGGGPAVISTTEYNDDNVHGGVHSAQQNQGFVNPKLTGIPMVRRSSDESRAEAPVAASNSGSSTTPSRQHTNRVAPLKEAEVDTPGSRLSALSLPGNAAPVLGQAATSVTVGGGGGVPDMRTHVKTVPVSGAVSTSSSPVTRAVVTPPPLTQPPARDTTSPRALQPPPPSAPTGCTSDETPGSNTHRSARSAVHGPSRSSPPHAEKLTDPQSQYQVTSAALQAATSSTSPSSSSSNPLSSSSLSPLSPTGSPEEIPTSCPPLTFVQEQSKRTTKEKRDKKQQQQHSALTETSQASIVDLSPNTQIHPLVNPSSLSDHYNNINNSNNNINNGLKNNNIENKDSGSCKSGELDFVLGGSQSVHPFITPDTVHYSKPKGEKDKFDKSSLDLSLHAVSDALISPSTPKDEDCLNQCPAKPISPTGSCYSGVGSLGPGVLTPVHSFACSPTQNRRLRKEPSFEDNTQIPLDFVYREGSAQAKRSSTTSSDIFCDNPVDCGTGNIVALTGGVEKVAKPRSSSNLCVATSKDGASGNVFRFLLDGQSIDLSCEDEDSLSRRRKRSASSGEDVSKVRRSYSTPTAFASRPGVDRNPLTDKKSLSVFLGSETSYSAHDDSANHSTLEESKVIFPSDKRFSAGQSSIVTVGTVATTDSDCKTEKHKDKKKRKRLWKRRSKHETDKDASSVLSVSLPGRESKRSSKGSGGSVGIGAFFRRRSKKDSENAGGTRPGEDNGDQDVGGSRPDSVAGSVKGPRRLARRGMGMFPSSNWRRLRNTLKAANEMQAPKKTKHTLTREDSFLRKFSTRNHHQNVQNSANSTDDDSRWGGSGGGAGGGGGCSGGGATYTSEGGVRRVHGRRFVIQHDGNFMFYWLGVVTVSVLYNLWTCIARQAFREIQQKCNECWFALDALFDTIYILDIIIQFRTGYLDQGLMVYDSRKLRDRYTHSRIVFIDFLCLMPLDFLQILIGIHPMIRFPRFLKVYRSFRFIHMLESRTAYPNLIRVANLTHILFLGAHWFAAFYYMISEAEDFTGEWAYPKPVGEFADVTRKYLRSLFWSTLTLTTIGDLPPPDNSEE
ncbi:cyclic nucleotide-gated cation channel [Elysia marginata]|uniref:Cyclic nucleotide-gated cation channel n=1 Tax=Elysia marginata TaxID=1093978 RepID=A0AAV4HSM1_9GAST|nr:cyclic nucleotide-gated cation channel [Elysia marginata]